MVPIGNHKLHQRYEFLVVRVFQSREVVFGMPCIGITSVHPYNEIIFKIPSEEPQILSWVLTILFSNEIFQHKYKPKL
jgi:hypothetical protein